MSEQRVTLNATEAQWQEVVVGFARLHGWLVHHTRPARRKDGSWRTPIMGVKGFPDLTLARYGELIFAELKAERGRLSEEQLFWLDHLHGEGREVYVWRPSDWEDVKERLARDWPEIRKRERSAPPSIHDMVGRPS